MTSLRDQVRAHTITHEDLEGVEKRLDDMRYTLGILTLLVARLVAQQAEPGTDAHQVMSWAVAQLEVDSTL